MEGFIVDREYKSSLKCLRIGDKIAELPIIQGGMGVGVSRGRLAGAVAIHRRSIASVNGKERLKTKQIKGEKFTIFPLLPYLK